jgi:hypothetical protein
MPIWINALGVAGFGAFYGFVLMYVLKRYLPPLMKTPPSIRDLIYSLTPMGAGGVMGLVVNSIDHINYTGIYGLGLMLGAAVNVGLTLWLGFTLPREDCDKLTD